MSIKTVLVNAGPWLAVPPPGYGGIENVVATLVPELRTRGVRVVLASVGSSTLEVDELLAPFGEGQFAHLARPYNQVSGITHTHMQRVVSELGRRDDIDLVHDHLEVVGPSMLAALGRAAPPTLHTLHWDLQRHPDFYAAFDGGGRVFVNGVSSAQLARGAASLQAQAVGAVPLGTPIPAAPPASADERGDFLLVLGRISPLKGQDVAARLCAMLGLPLVLAGPVASARTEEELDAGLADPDSGLARNGDVRFFLDEVRPHVDGRTVRWIGAVGEPLKSELLRTARALLMPIRWEEPGATVVTEAFAAGTPVVGTRRGVLPSLIDHGVTGFLADDADEDGLMRAIKRVEELDPAQCRRVAEERFTPGRMAEQYLDLYAEVARRAAAR